MKYRASLGVALALSLLLASCNTAPPVAVLSSQTDSVAESPVALPQMTGAQAVYAVVSKENLKFVKSLQIHPPAAAVKAGQNVLFKVEAFDEYGHSMGFLKSSDYHYSGGTGIWTSHGPDGASFRARPYNTKDGGGRVRVSLHEKRGVVAEAVLSEVKLHNGVVSYTDDELVFPRADTDYLAAPSEIIAAQLGPFSPEEYLAKMPTADKPGLAPLIIKRRISPFVGEVMHIAGISPIFGRVTSVTKKGEYSLVTLDFRDGNTVLLDFRNQVYIDTALATEPPLKVEPYGGGSAILQNSSDVEAVASGNTKNIPPPRPGEILRRHWSEYNKIPKEFHREDCRAQIETHKIEVDLMPLELNTAKGLSEITITAKPKLHVSAGPGGLNFKCNVSMGSARPFSVGPYASGTARYETEVFIEAKTDIFTFHVQAGGDFSYAAHSKEAQKPRFYANFSSPGLGFNDPDGQSGSTELSASVKPQMVISIEPFWLGYQRAAFEFAQRMNMAQKFKPLSVDIKAGLNFETKGKAVSARDVLSGAEPSNAERTVKLEFDAAGAGQAADWLEKMGVKLPSAKFSNELISDKTSAPKALNNDPQVNIGKESTTVKIDWSDPKNVTHFMTVDLRDKSEVWHKKTHFNVTQEQVVRTYDNRTHKICRTRGNMEAKLLGFAHVTWPNGERAFASVPVAVAGKIEGCNRIQLFGSTTPDWGQLGVFRCEEKNLKKGRISYSVSNTFHPPVSPSVTERDSPAFEHETDCRIINDEEGMKQILRNVLHQMHKEYLEKQLKEKKWSYVQQALGFDLSRYEPKMMCKQGLSWYEVSPEKCLGWINATVEFLFIPKTIPMDKIND